MDWSLYDKGFCQEKAKTLDAMCLICSRLPIKSPDRQQLTIFTALKVSKYGPEKNPYLDTLHAVILTPFWPVFPFYVQSKHQKTFGFIVLSVL